MKTIKFFYLTLAVSTFAACQSSDKTSDRFQDSSTLTERAASEGRTDTKNETHEASVNDDGAAFIKDAGIGGMMEVDLGKIAAQNASSAEVKAFAARMIADHTKANNELKAIAEKNGILVPTEYPADVKVHIDAMKKMKGAEFDKHYMDMMVNDHVKTLNLFKSASLKDDVLKDFAVNTLPVLEEHHKMAAEINSKLK